MNLGNEELSLNVFETSTIRWENT